jgi:hypothetical protein
LLKGQYLSVLNLGPKFHIEAKIVGNVADGVDVKVRFSHKIDNTQVFYPPVGSYSTNRIVPLLEKANVCMFLVLTYVPD